MLYIYFMDLHVINDKRKIETAQKATFKLQLNVDIILYSDAYVIYSLSPLV